MILLYYSAQNVNAFLNEFYRLITQLNNLTAIAELSWSASLKNKKFDILIRITTWLKGYSYSIISLPDFRF